jgi:DNA (cytosine-5)-methyltransferase 1
MTDEAYPSPDAGREAGWREGTAALGGSEPDADVGPRRPLHRSYFSGVGGLDLGFERAGIRTISLSEIDPYASAVLSERFPDVPNLGDITRLESVDDPVGDIWSGGFPCQDLSIAGSRRGLAGERSGLAFAYLDLVGRYRPRYVVLENVTGLWSSHSGRDMAALFGRLVDGGYGVAARTLDASLFGVPQRRRRVFVVGVRGDDDDPELDLAAERAGAILAVGAICRRHPPSGIEAGEESPGDAIPRAQVGVDIAHAQSGTGYKGHDPDQETIVVTAASPDAGRSRASDGLDGRLDDRGAVEATYVKRHRAASAEDAESWSAGDVSPTLTGHDISEARTTTVVAASPNLSQPDDLLPEGIDGHRYRAIGNGVVAPVAEWIGRRILADLEGRDE